MMFGEVVERNHGGRGREGGVAPLLNAAELRHDLTNHEDFYGGTVSMEMYPLLTVSIAEKCCGSFRRLSFE
jgi:hypothetical protein